MLIQIETVAKFAQTFGTLFSELLLMNIPNLKVRKKNKVFQSYFFYSENFIHLTIKKLGAVFDVLEFCKIFGIFGVF